MKISIYTDGGARGNPGISGYGVVVYDQSKQIIYSESKFLGIKTNNEAEYMAQVAALTWLKDNVEKLSIDEVDFYSDSQLMVRQMQGIYKVKAGNLLELYNVAKTIVNSFSFKTKYHDIRREFNKAADELANQAMDNKC